MSRNTADIRPTREYSPEVKDALNMISMIYEYAPTAFSPVDPSKNLTAVLVKKLDGFQGDARLYKLSEPIDADGLSYDYVVVSAAVVYLDGPETLIFPSDGYGKVLSWGDLPGSFRGALDHKRALRNAGYEVL